MVDAEISRAQPTAVRTTRRSVDETGRRLPHRPLVPPVPDALLRWAAPLLLEAGVLLVLLLSVVAGPSTALVLLAAVAAGTALVRRPQWSVYLCVAFAFTELPAAAPSEFVVGGYTFYAFEPFLVVAAVWTLLTARSTPWGNVVTGALLVVLLGWAAFGIAAGNAAPKIIFDVRPLAHVCAATFIGLRVAGTPTARNVARMLPYILWFSAALLVVASTTGLAISGSAEQATLYLQSATSDATRLRGPATDLAMVVLSTCVALFLMKRARTRTLVLMAAPSFLIVFLAFSRYTVFGVAFAVGFALIAACSFRTVFRTVALLVVVGGLGLGIGIAAPSFAGVPGGNWVASQVSGFQNRVLDGLTSKVIDADGSAQYRVREDSNLIPNIGRSPIFGHGFGYAYKPPEPPANSFFTKYGPYYAHNYYLWLLVKTGIAGAALLLGAILVPALLALRRPTAATTSLAITVGALMTTSFAAPMPNGDLTATLLGGALGLLVAQLTGRGGDYPVLSPRVRAAPGSLASGPRPSAAPPASMRSRPRSGTSIRQATNWR